MCAFLIDVDEQMWMVVEDGWKCPTFVEDEVAKPKQMGLWTPEEMERANFNSKAMHTLFNVVSKNQLKVIANCKIAKEAWEKLRIKNEGTNHVKKSRLRALAKAFENLSMEEEETVAEFHAKLCDISNKSYALGKTYSNAKLVHKVLGVLPRKFMSKVTSIEEMRNVEELDLDELIGSLQNYEMTLTRWKKGKKQKDSEIEEADNSLAFVHKEEKKSISDASDGFTDETLALLTKNYAKFLKRNYKKNFTGGKENVPRRNFGGNNKQTQQSGDKKNRGIQCRECDGFRHIQAEYANTFKKKKALVATWSDSDEEKSSSSSDRSSEEKQVVAFMAKNLIRAKQALEFIPPGTTAINHTLQLQKPYGDRTSIGYKMLYKRGGNLGINDSSSSKNNEDKTLDDSLHNTLSPGFPDPSKQVQKERFVPICHFYNRRGHIRPRFYKLQTYLKAMIDRPNNFQQLNRFNGKLSYSEWKPKTNLSTNVGLAAHTSLSAFHKDQCYFDSGCSRHMTGNRNVLVNYKKGKEGDVTFCDGNKGQIFGKGDQELNRVAPLTEELYVKGLKENLISISQLCDNDNTNESLSGKRFVMVLVDDYSRYTWVDFLKEKSDTFGLFLALVLRLQNEKESKIGKVYQLQSDHGKEFENTVFSDFCDQLGIKHEFSTPKSTQ
ncbi:uncharacterized protein LOC133785341 [Humulus lupulus]|uniref:uncharacterized protein LOC133785341 n=1 Tax=Humulus lupulus TaxID=3486 RepID=UPI002B410B63|nr:uncharacterized protein LOC133785341 [Humulus lupulus]